MECGALQHQVAVREVIVVEGVQGALSRWLTGGMIFWLIALEGAVW